MSVSLLDLKFVLLLCLIGLLRWLWPVRQYALLGALCSAAVIGWAAPKALAVIVGLTVLYLYPVHRLYRLAQKKGWPERARSGIMVGAIVGLVLILVVFKLYRHFTLPWLGGEWIRQEVLALIGVSYFIFRAINFLHIQSILGFDETRPWTLLFYTLFPPTFTSGPIQKFQDFRQQVQSPAPLNLELLGTAAYRVTRGFFRKIVLAVLFERLATHLLGIQQPTVYISVLAIVSLYVYFYFDFAGYSDIAIGLGLLLGIKVPENFRKPFTATTVSEFWRNWHITLVDWFRDHVFIPLGGMKASRLHAAALAMLIMVFCGLWHGLTWNFAAWGLWHGSILFAEAVSGARPVPPALRHGWSYWSRVAWTNAKVALGAVFFLDWATIQRVMGGFANWSIS